MIDRTWMKAALTPVWLSCLAAAAPAQAQEPAKVAVFGFELIDTSLEGELSGVNPDETARLAMLTEQLRDTFAEATGYEVVDIGPVADRAAERTMHECNGCDATLARELGADLAVIGTVQKVSNLILNINLYVRDADSGDLTQVMSADIRSNTDEAWTRGLDWLIRNRLDLGG